MKTRIDEILKKAGIGKTAFSEWYKIPIRTINSWSSGEREAPEYVLDLLERAVEEDFGEYMLHNLRCNPDDLPAENKRVLFLQEGTEFITGKKIFEWWTGFYRNGKFASDDTSDDCYMQIFKKENVLKWRYLKYPEKIED